LRISNCGLVLSSPVAELLLQIQSAIRNPKSEIAVPKGNCGLRISNCGLVLSSPVVELLLQIQSAIRNPKSEIAVPLW